MTQKSKRTIGAEEQRFNNIMNSRLTLGQGHVGQVIRAKVSGNPQWGYYDDRIDALKDIYSFNVNKMTTIQSDWFRTNHAKAIALEQAGETEAARELFNDLMNKSQLNLGVINRDGMKEQFSSGQVVDLLIGVTDVEDKDENGVGLGTTHKALIVESISRVQATVLTRKALFGADVEEEEEEPAAEPAAKVAKA